MVDIPVSVTVAMRGDAEIISRVSAVQNAIDGVGKAAAGSQAPLNNAGQAMATLGQSSTTAADSLNTASGSVKKFGSDVSSGVNQAKGSITGIVAPTGQAADAMDKFGAISVTSTQKAGDALNQFGTTAASTGQKTQTVGQAARTLGGAFQSSVGAVTSMTGGVLGLWHELDALDRAQLSANKSSLAMERAQFNLTNQQNKLNAMRASGKASAADLAKQEDAVRLAQEKVEITTDNNRIKQEDLNQTYAHFASNIIPSVLSVGGSAVSMFGTLKQNSGALKEGITGLIGGFSSFGGTLKGILPSFSSLRSSAAGLPSSLGGAKASISGFGGALSGVGPSSIVASTGLKGLALSAKGLLLSLGAIGIAMIGITALMTALATNAFGIRDAFNAAGKALGDMFPILKPLLNGLTELGRMLGLTGDSAIQTAEAQKDLSSATEATTSTLDDNSNAAKISMLAYQKLQAANIENVRAAAQYLMTQTKVVNLEKLSNEQIIALAEGHKKNTAATQDNLNSQVELVAKYTDLQAIAKALGDGTFPQLYASLKKYDDQQQASGKATEKNASDLLKITTVLDDLAKSWDENAAKAQKLADQLGIQGSAALQNSRDWSVFGTALEEVKKNTIDAEDATRSHAEALKIMHPELATNVDLIHGNIDAIKEWVANSEDQIKATEDAKDTLRTLSDGYTNHIQANKLLIQTLDKGIDVTKLSAKELEALAQADVDAAQHSDDFYFSVVKAAKAVGFSGDITEKSIPIMIKWAATHKTAQQAAEDNAKAEKKAADERQKHLDEINKLIPAVRGLVVEYEKANDAGSATVTVNDRIVDHLENVSKNYQTARAAAEEFATQHGVSIPKAVSLTDDALLKEITTFAQSDEQIKKSAENQKQVAKDMADAWNKALDASIKSLDTWAQNFGKAFDDAEKDINVFTSGLEPRALTEFWEKFIPTTIINDRFLQAKTSMSDFVKDISKNVKDMVKSGTITDAQSKEMFQPFLNNLKALPGSMKENFGSIVASAVHFGDDLKPALLAGIITVGPAAKAAIKTNFEDKMIEALQEAKGPLSSGFIDTVNTAINNLKASNPDVANFIKTSLDLAGPGVQDKVNKLIAILEQISPGFKDQIAKIDSDSDGLPDIIDKNFNSPFEGLKNSIVDAFKTILVEIGALPKSVLDATSGVSNAVTNMSSTIKTQTNAAGISLGDMVNKTNTLGTAWATTSSASTKNIDSYGTSVTGAATTTGKATGSMVTDIQNLENQTDTVTRLAILWTGHQQVIQGVAINVARSLGELAVVLKAFVTATTTGLGIGSGAWSTHQKSVSGSMAAIGTSLRSVNPALLGYQNAVGSTFANATKAIASSVSSANSQLSSLSRTFVNVRSSALNAASGVNSLRSSIAALQSKTVTVTTIHKTVNQTVTAAKGFSGIVSSQTNFTVGEGGKPEFVQVIPLAGGGSRSGGSGNTTVNATAAPTGIQRLSRSAGTGGGIGGGTKTLNLNISVPVDGRVIGQVSRKFNLDNLSGQF